MKTIEKEDTSLLSSSLVLNFLFPIIIEKSKNGASEVDILSFLSCRSEGYKSPIKRNRLPKRCLFLSLSFQCLTVIYSHSNIEID